MIDRQELRKAYQRAAVACAGLTTIPLLLVGVALSLYSAGSSASGEPGSGDLPLVQLAVYGVVALSPLLTVPLVRASFRRQPRQTAGSPAAIVPKPEALMPAQSVVLYALWEISSLMGFVAFFLGATWGVFLAAVAFTYVGYALTFPRWSAWQQRADELDAQPPGHPTIG